MIKMLIAHRAPSRASILLRKIDALWAQSPRLSDDGAGRSRLKGLTPNLLGLTHTYYHSLRYHHKIYVNIYI